MNNTLIIIVPLLLLIALWIVLAQLRREPLQASTHFGFTITLIVLIGFGLWTMVSLSSSGWLSGMSIYLWMLLCVPVGIVTYLLAIASFTLFHARKSHQQSEDLEKDASVNRRKVQLSFAFVALFLIITTGYFYVEHLESRLRGQQATETSLRALYHNPMVRLFPHLRARLGYHHTIPLDLLAKLFDDSNQDVWWVACMNDKATDELLYKASKSSWPNNKECVLANRNAPVELLREWSRADNDRIRGYVARHKNTPADVLLVLSMDDSSSVRGSVAINVAASGEALARLAESDNPNQRGNVASHVNTPVFVLETLAKDPDTKVRTLARRRLNDHHRYIRN